ncbi:trypsin, partial [Oesophagostomum dentatum]
TSPEKSYILTGLTSLSNPKHTHHVARTVVHPEYDAKQIRNDVALVKSRHSLFNDGISSVCITRNDSAILSSVDEGIVTGFGLHIVSGSIFGVTMGVSDVVLQTSLPIIPLNKCRREWRILSGGAITISDNQLCAGSRLRGTGPGDSGGPLLAKDANGRLVQIGITSFGAGGIQGLLDQSTYPEGKPTIYLNYMDIISPVQTYTRKSQSVTRKSLYLLLPRKVSMHALLPMFLGWKQS